MNTVIPPPSERQAREALRLLTKVTHLEFVIEHLQESLDAAVNSLEDYGNIYFRKAELLIKADYYHDKSGYKFFHNNQWLDITVDNLQKLTNPDEEVIVWLNGI